jgi:hypothetical protein
MGASVGIGFTKAIAVLSKKSGAIGTPIGLKAVLHPSTAIVVGLRHNPVIQKFYKRIRAAGKPAQVALKAFVHKLLIILNVMVKNRQKWNPKHQRILLLNNQPLLF